MVLMMLACKPDASLSADAIYTRASLDLRGVRPSVAELDIVDDDSLDAELSALFDDPRYETRMRDVFADRFLTRQDSWVVQADDVGSPDTPTFVEAVGDEVPALLARVAADDLPWTTILTADWTMAHPAMGYGFDTAVTDWQVARYTDGRPAAGVLATNGFWWTYGSTESNANRGRANAITRLYLCDDYLAADVIFDPSVDLSDSEAVRTALSTNPSCVYCHQSLDPLASHLFGFTYLFDENPVERLVYHPERQNLWRAATGVAPGYFGQPSTDLGDLARHIANDDRFATCAVEQAYAVLVEPPSLENANARIVHRNAFIEGGLTLRALQTSIIASDAYRAPTERLADPALLGSQLEALTGYRLRFEGYDALRNDAVGLRTLAGGADGRFVTANAAVPSPTTLLVQEQLAFAAAAHAVQARSWPSEQADVEVTLLHWTRAAWSVDIDASTLAALRDLWAAVYAREGLDPAWTATLGAIFADPDVVVY